MGWGLLNSPGLWDEAGDSVIKSLAWSYFIIHVFTLAFWDGGLCRSDWLGTLSFPALAFPVLRSQVGAIFPRSALMFKQSYSAVSSHPAWLYSPDISFMSLISTIHSHGTFSVWIQVDKSSHHHISTFGLHFMFLSAQLRWFLFCFVLFSGNLSKSTSTEILCVIRKCIWASFHSYLPCAG